MPWCGDRVTASPSIQREKVSLCGSTPSLCLLQNRSQERGCLVKEHGFPGECGGRPSQGSVLGRCSAVDPPAGCPLAAPSSAPRLRPPSLLSPSSRVSSSQLLCLLISFQDGAPWGSASLVWSSRPPLPPWTPSPTLSPLPTSSSACSPSLPLSPCLSFSPFSSLGVSALSISLHCSLFPDTLLALRCAHHCLALPAALSPSPPPTLLFSAASLSSAPSPQLQGCLWKTPASQARLHPCMLGAQAQPVLALWARAAQAQGWIGQAAGLSLPGRALIWRAAPSGRPTRRAHPSTHRTRM